MTSKTLVSVVLSAFVLGAGPGAAQDMMFGGEKDQAYAANLWQVMVDMKLAGDGMIASFPYEGVEPHGMMLETFYTFATVGGHTGALVVKRNYGPEGVSVDEVLGDPGTHLGAYTVMFQREDGYDPDNQNWFWVKYLPDGSLDATPDGMALAGMVGKNADAGCIACHKGDPDYLFTTDASVTMMK